MKGKNKPKKAGLQGGKAGKKDDMNYDGLGAEFDDFIWESTNNLQYTRSAEKLSIYHSCSHDFNIILNMADQ